MTLSKSSPSVQPPLSTLNEAAMSEATTTMMRMGYNTNTNNINNIDGCNSSSSAAASTTKSPLDVHILLSRPYYRIGDYTPVVGTILVQRPYCDRNSIQQQQQLPHPQSLRDRITSLQFTMIGLCRYDPRWFNINKVKNNTEYSTTIGGLPNDYEFPPYTIPFWSSSSNNNETSSLELLNIPERNYGKWDNVDPMQPIPLPSTSAHRRVSSSSSSSSRQQQHSSENESTCTNKKHDTRKSSNEKDISTTTTTTTTMDENHQLAYTFRINVPTYYYPNNAANQFTMPHTFHGVSCRYYYIIVVRLQQRDDVVWIHQPITILPAFHPDDIGGGSDVCTATPNSTSNSSSSLSSPSSVVQVMAHSNGLPTRLTSIEMNDWEGRYTVNRQCTAMYQNLTRLGGGQSMSIIDPTSQCFIGTLTILGTPNNLRFGSRITLKMEFPIRLFLQQNDNDATTTTKNSIPCYQVCACLQGQEIAITTTTSSSSSMNATSNQNSGGKLTMARRYIWDTAYESIDPDTTECIALDLLVPESASCCSIQTPNVELNIQCIIDITIGTTSVKSSKIEYRNIHLEIPCHVRPTLHDWELQRINSKNDGQQEMSSSSQQQQQYSLPDSLRQLYDTAKQLRHQQQMYGRTTTKEENENNNLIVDQTAATAVVNHHSVVGGGMDTSDIQTDLKLLSLQMAKICHILPKTADP